MSSVTLPRITVDSRERCLKERTMSAIQPIIATSDLARPRTFYERLLGAVQVRRFPDGGSPSLWA